MDQYYNIKTYSKQLAIVILLFSFSKSWGQTIVSDNFENTSTLFTNTGATYYNGNSLAGDGPASSSFASLGTYGIGISNGTAILTSSLINTSACSSVQLTFKLAAFSIGVTTNGVETSDNVKVEISPDGGITFYNTIQVNGNLNAYWGYTTGTGIASTPYDGNVTPVLFAPGATTGNKIADGYSTVTITGLPTVTNLVVKITMLNNSTAERWIIDNFILSGTCSSCTPPTTTVTPTTQTLCAGTATTISISSSATTPSYTWQASANGSTGWAAVTSNTPIGASYSGQGTATLSITAGSTYYYQCLVAEGGTCTATSSTSTLVVNATTSLTTQTTPSSSVACFGTATSFSVGATGTTLTYQWQVSTGGAFSNATGGAYINGTTNVLNIGTSQATGSYFFQCLVTGACGAVTSNIATLTVAATPAAPSTPIIATSNPACNSATVSANGTPPLNVTWYWETSGTASVTTNSAATPTVLTASGTQWIRAKSDLAACWSPTAAVTVTVNTGISISSCPSSSVVCEGAGTTVKFAVSGSGGTPYANAWQVNSGSGYTTITDNATYTGSAAQTLTINTTALSAGVYSFQPIVSNACGTASCVTTLTVVSIPTAPPTPSVISTCNTAVISETVVGTPPAGVTWYWASNANAPTSFTSAVNDYSITSSGTVYIRANSNVGSCWNSAVTTNSVAVTVIKSPTITTQPTSTVICQGSTASFKVSMSGTSPLTFQWQENTGSGFVNISSVSPYTISVGTSTCTLGIDNTKPVGTYTYQCVISNSCGTATSNIVTLTINSAPANDLCSNASSIVIGAAAVSGILDCAGPTAGLTYVPTYNDVWYAFTPTCTATFTVTMKFTTSVADYDLDVFNTSSCPSTGSATYTSHGTSSVETVSQSFTSGVTYYVRVIDYNGTGGTFSISVNGNCGAPHTAIFDSNGGAGSMSNQTANSATNLTSNAFTNSGCTFVNWNDSANANGTSYANSAVYSFTADVTLYAQWSCASGGGGAGCPYLVSAVVNACAGSCNAEGQNELVVMNSGNYVIPVNGTNINLYYSGGTNHYFTNSFAASPGTAVSNLNTLAATSGCTNTPFIFVSSGGTIPVNSKFMILNNNSCFNGDFSAYCNSGPIYVIICTDVDWSSGGYFGNNSTPRYFRTDFSNVNSGCGLTTYNYNNPSTFSFGADGASVAFSGTTPSYIVGNGTCAPNIAILPIDLLDFYATKNGKGNEVIWKVAQEKNILYYTIEKSKDAIDFTELATVYPNNSIHTKSYSVFDSEPYRDITYYRLSTKEVDGTSKNYKIISVNEADNKWEYIHYQTENNLVLEFKNALPKNSVISLYDISGKELISQAIKHSQTTLDTEILASGVYFVRLATPYKTEHFKIIITK